MLSREEARNRPWRKTPDERHAENACTAGICYCAGLPTNREGSIEYHAPDCLLNAKEAICECFGRAWTAVLGVEFGIDRRKLTADEERRVLEHWKAPPAARALSMSAADRQELADLAEQCSGPLADVARALVKGNAQASPGRGPNAAERDFDKTKFDPQDWPIFESVYNTWDEIDARRTGSPNGSKERREWVDWPAYFRWYGQTYPEVAAAHPKIFDLFLRKDLPKLGEILDWEQSHEHRPALSANPPRSAALTTNHAQEHAAMTTPRTPLESESFTDLGVPVPSSPLDWAALRHFERELTLAQPRADRDKIAAESLRSWQQQKLIEQYKAAHSDASTLDALGACTALFPETFTEEQAPRDVARDKAETAAAAKMSAEVAAHQEQHGTSYAEALRALLEANPRRWA